MSQNTRNQPGGGQENSGRSSGTERDRKNYEGFDGMNYEQIRQPYNPEHTTNNDRENSNGGSGKRRDAL